jgi:hypothetical protein
MISLVIKEYPEMVSIIPVIKGGSLPRTTGRAFPASIFSSKTPRREP